MKRQKRTEENCFQELFSEQPVSGFAEADAAAADEETEDNKKEETFGKDEEGGDKEDKDYGDGDGDGNGEETQEDVNQLALETTFALDLNLKNSQ